jgi:hypothetical protein
LVLMYGMASSHPCIGEARSGSGMVVTCHRHAAASAAGRRGEPSIPLLPCVARGAQPRGEPWEAWARAAVRGARARAACDRRGQRELATFFQYLSEGISMLAHDLKLG